jgi:hypothetical protein
MSVPIERETGRCVRVQCIVDGTEFVAKRERTLPRPIARPPEIDEEKLWRTLMADLLQDDSEHDWQ